MKTEIKRLFNGIYHVGLGDDCDNMAAIQTKDAHAMPRLVLWDEFLYTPTNSIRLGQISDAMCKAFKAR